MLDAINEFFSTKGNGSNYSNLPQYMRDDIADAMEATSLTDIR